MMKSNEEIKVSVVQPKVVTLLTTFKCSAKCANCCFQCSPTVSKKMTFEEMKEWIGKCVKAYPSIDMVVFSGGECTLLGKTLLKIISFASSLGLHTRIVTNAWWANSYKTALNYVEKLKVAGLTEINFSTGDDHQRWIPFRYVRNAAVASFRKGLGCAINVETHDKSKFDFEKCLLKDRVLASCCSSIINGERHIYVEHGVWASMREQDGKPFRYDMFKASLNYKRCNNLFDNIPINPYGEVLACCGITSERNPYLRLGNIKCEEIHRLYERSFMDILKVWLYVSGPISILQFIYDVKKKTYDVPAQHMCVLCKGIFENAEYMSILKAHINDYAPSVLLKYNLLIKQFKK